MKKALTILVLLLLAGCIISCISMRVATEYFRIEFERIAHDHSFEPTNHGLSQYIRSIVKVGMSSAEVEKALKQIGPLSVKQGQPYKNVLPGARARCDVVSVRMNALSIWNLDVLACYNSSDHLLFLTAVDLDAYPDLTIGQ